MDLSDHEEGHGEHHSQIEEPHIRADEGIMASWGFHMAEELYMAIIRKVEGHRRVEEHHMAEGLHRAGVHHRVDHKVLEHHMAEGHHRAEEHRMVVRKQEHHRGRVRHMVDRKVREHHKAEELHDILGEERHRRAEEGDRQ